MSEAPDALAAVLRDRYQLERELGRGGMATVYLARDLKHDRLVALKVLRPELGAVLGAERFLREIRLTAGLDHPHIVPMLDSGETAGLLWYTMPFVEGETLRRRLQRERQVPLEDALHVVGEVADALAYAHRRGLVHRDVKPENILLAGGHARLSDFGIARAVEAGGERLTETGLAVGTPAYMSPEQALGQDVVDHRADIYALGCVLYEMLAGEPPYNGPTAQAIVAKAAAAPVPSLRPVRPDVPDAVDRAIRRALAKSPAARFASAGDLIRAAAERPDRRWRVLAATAAVVLVGSAGVWAWTALARRTFTPGAGDVASDDLPVVAVLPTVVADLSPHTSPLGDGTSDALIGALSDQGGFRVPSALSVSRYRGRTIDPVVVGRETGWNYLVTTSARGAGTRIRIHAALVATRDGLEVWSGTIDRDIHQAADVFDLQDTVAAQVARALATRLDGPVTQPRVKRGTTDLEAYAEYALGRSLFSEYRPESFVGSIEHFRRALARDSAYAQAYAGLADAYSLQGLRGGTVPREAFALARSAAVRAIALDDRLGDAHAALGFVQAIFDRDWKAAERSFRRALEVSPGSVFARTWYAAFVLTPQGRHDEAIAMIREAARLDPLNPPVRYNVGFRYYFARRFNEAEREFRRLLDREPAFLAVHQGLGLTYLAQGRFAEGIEETHADAALLGNVTLLGYAYALAGRGEDARRILDRLRDSARTSYVQPMDFSLIYAGLGESDSAFAHLENARVSRAGYLVFINEAPWYDRVRSDPRFAPLVRSLGLRPKTVAEVESGVVNPR